MKSKFLIFCILLFFSKVSALENLDIKSKKISINKKNEITTFQDEVIIKDELNNVIKSDYVLYNKKLKKLDIKENYPCFSFGKGAKGFSYHPNFKKDIIEIDSAINKKNIDITLTLAYVSKSTHLVYLYDTKKIFFIYFMIKK